MSRNGSENPSPQQLYRQIEYLRVKNSGQVRICVPLGMSLMAGKDLKSVYVGFRARQSLVDYGIV